MIGIICIVSFLLDGLISTGIHSHSLLYPLCSIICLVVLFPYFKYHDRRFFYYAGLLGFFYDIAYTDTLYLNFFLFLLLAVLIRQLYFWLSSSVVSTFFLSLFSIVFYRCCTYLLLVLIGYFSFHVSMLLEGIYCSLLFNLVYAILLYFVCIFFARRFKITKSK